MSDQDFFFDEEPAKKDKPTDKPAKSGAQKSTAKSGGPAPKAAPAPVATPFLEQSVTMSVAGMLGVIGILIGVIVGFLLGGGMGGASNLPDTSLTAPAASTTGSQTAPPLTPEQMQGGSGGLPAGHPKLGGSTTPTPTK